MSRITDALSEKQVARAHMRAGSGFETEASVTVTPMGLLAIGGMMGAILLSTAAIVRAARRRGVRRDHPETPALEQPVGMPLLKAHSPVDEA